MNLVLKNYDYKFVLLEKCPLELATNALRAAKEAFDHWVKANNKAKCYMLVGMSELLRKQHKDMTTTYEIVKSLDEMFGQPYKKCRLEAVKKFMNHKMKLGTPVCAHVLKMIDYLHEAKLNEAKIDIGT